MPTIDIGFWQHHLRHDAKPPPSNRKKKHEATPCATLVPARHRDRRHGRRHRHRHEISYGQHPDHSSTGYVLSVAFPNVSYGVFMFFWNILLLIGQVIILRRRFQLLALLQIPISVLFSLSIDGFASLLSWFAPAELRRIPGHARPRHHHTCCRRIAHGRCKCGHELRRGLGSRHHLENRVEFRPHQGRIRYQLRHHRLRGFARHHGKRDGRPRGHRSGRGSHRVRRELLRSQDGRCAPSPESRRA